MPELQLWKIICSQKVRNSVKRNEEDIRNIWLKKARGRALMRDIFIVFSAHNMYFNKNFIRLSNKANNSEQHKQQMMCHEISDRSSAQS